MSPFRVAAPPYSPPALATLGRGDSWGAWTLRIVYATLLNASMPATKVVLVPGSMAEWPASGTIV